MYLFLSTFKFPPFSLLAIIFFFGLYVCDFNFSNFFSQENEAESTS